MLANIENLIVFYSKSVPLEIFSLLGGFLEDLISPIPSPLIMTTAGSLAFAQSKPFLYLIFLSMLAGLGKTLGAIILYYISEKFEDIFVPKVGKYVGLKKDDFELIGTYFNKTWKDDLLLIILRFIPVIPALPVSFACGVIHLNMKTYIRSSFIGNTLRSFLFAVIGYIGISGFVGVLEKFEAIEDIIIYTTVILGSICIVVLYKFKEKINLHNLIKKYFGNGNKDSLKN